MDNIMDTTNSVVSKTKIKMFNSETGQRRVPDSLASRMLQDKKAKLSGIAKKKGYVKKKFALQSNLTNKSPRTHYHYHRTLKYPRTIKPYSKTLNRLLYKNRNFLDKLLGEMKIMEPNDQLNLWKGMIDSHSFNLDQLRVLRTAIDDRIKIDIISGVPYEIALYIMTFLSPEDLCQAAQTCRSWRTVCEDNRLWREKCKEEGLLSDEHTLETLFKTRIQNRDVKQNIIVKESLSSVGKLNWKGAYLRHMDIIRNWRTRRFEISEPFIASNLMQPNQSRSDVSQNAGQSWFRFRQQRQTARRTNNPAQDASGIPRSLKVQYNLSDCSSDNSQNPKNQNDDVDSGQENDARSDDVEGPISPNWNENLDNPAHLMQLRCHEDSVITCLQYNPTTSTIVSGSDDQTLKVWSSETGRCITTLEGHTGGVWSSQLSANNIVVSGSTDRTLKVWKAHTGKLMHTLYGHTSTVRCLALDGDRVVSGSRDSTIRLWDINKGVCMHVFQGHSAAVRCVEYKNNIIVSGAYDHLVMVWDAVTGNCCHALECHYSRIYSLQFDGKTIASGSLDSSICIWDAATGKLRHHLEGHTSLTSKMQLKGSILVSANADSFCKIWNINTGECLQTLGGENKHTSAITSVYFNNRYVVTSSDDGTVKLWDIGTGNFIRDLVVLPTASNGGVVWRIRASYTKLICAVGSRTQTEDTHLLVLDFSDN